MVFLAKGTFTLGQRTVDGQGNVIKETKAAFVTDPGGGCVVVGTLDDDTMEQTGEAALFGDYDHWSILNKALQLLTPTRPGNMPEFESIFAKMYKEDPHDCPFRPYCDKIRCADCVCWDWIDGIEEADDGGTL